MYGKNVFNKEAGVLANIFGVLATIWLLPIIIIFFMIQSVIDLFKAIIKKIKSWI